MIKFLACGHLLLGACLSAGDRLQAPLQKEQRGGVAALGARNICSDKGQPTSDMIAPSAPTRDGSWRTAGCMMCTTGCDATSDVKGAYSKREPMKSMDTHHLMRKFAKGHLTINWKLAAVDVQHHHVSEFFKLK